MRPRNALLRDDADFRCTLMLSNAQTPITTAQISILRDIRVAAAPEWIVCDLNSKWVKMWVLILKWVKLRSKEQMAREKTSTYVPDPK
jgi:hypothetical protein